MTWLTEKLAGRVEIDLVQKGLLPPSEETDLCVWFRLCSSDSKNVYSEFCSTDLSKTCESYKLMEQETLNELSKKAVHMSPKELTAVLKDLPTDVYFSYLKHVLNKSTKAFARENIRCLDKNGCSLDINYDLEHP